MFQQFSASSVPTTGPARLAALRAALAKQGVTGAIVPRADAYQGEYVAPCDDRLAWLTSFTGSAGLCIVLPEIAGLFVDGRYTLQARSQCDMEAFTPVDWPTTNPGEWIKSHAPEGAVIGFDPWLHTPREIKALRATLGGTTLRLEPIANPVDAVWPDRPPPPSAPATDHPEHLTGRSAAKKRADICAQLRLQGASATVLTQPDAICWLLNIRGADLPRVPVVLAFAILHASGRMDIFADPAKFTGCSLDGTTQLHVPDAFAAALGTLNGMIWLDESTAPQQVADLLTRAGASILWREDPCTLPKACKTRAELDGARAAHRRDGAAVVTFLAWLDAQAKHLCADTGMQLTEIDLVRHLEACRMATGVLHDISFDTIAGSGPNGAIVHYRVTEASNRALQPGDLMLIDSGGQYRDGTTDITRTVAIGPADTHQAQCFTRVLQGMIAVSRARFPRGVAGAHLDALARYPLWLAGLDYDHGTGHGVGSFLSVHEGPQRLSRLGSVPLAEGMILSNEPGYYRKDAFGIRIENLCAVRAAHPLAGADPRDWLEFETLTLAPVDRRLILAEMLSADERDWLNQYHAQVAAELAPLVPPEVRDWLMQACLPI